MALYKDGKVYRTLEQQVGYLSEKQNEQEVINEEVSQDIDDLEATVAVLPTKEYVDEADALKTNKGEEIRVVEISTTSGTLSDDEFNLLSLNNVIVKYSSYYLVKILSTTNLYRFAGLISSGSHFYLCEISKSTKEYTITYSKIKVDADGVLNDYSAEIIGKILTVKSDYSSGWETNSPEGNNVKSTSETSGKVLTSNGTGGASWQTPSGSSFDHYVVVTGTSGTLTQKNYDKLTYNDSVFIYNNSGTYQVYQKYDETNTNIRFRFCNIKGNNYVLDFTINKSTRSYSRDSATIQASGLSSTGATNGQVLTADGNGGTSWKTPSGGGGSGHTLTFTNSGGVGSLTLYYNDGTSKNITNSGTYNNVVAFTSSYSMCSTESGFLLDNTFSIIYEDSIEQYDVYIPLTDTSIKSMGGGG